MSVGMIIVLMTMLIEIILVMFLEIVLLLVDLGRAMGVGRAMTMAIRAVVFKLVTIMFSHGASAYVRFRFSIFKLPPSVQPIVVGA